MVENVKLYYLELISKLFSDLFKLFLFNQCFNYVLVNEIANVLNFNHI